MPRCGPRMGNVFSTSATTIKLNGSKAVICMESRSRTFFLQKRLEYFTVGKAFSFAGLRMEESSFPWRRRGYLRAESLGDQGRCGNRPTLESRLDVSLSGPALARKCRHLSITADGKQLAVLRRTLQTDVYVAELEPGGKAMKNPRRLTLVESR